MWSPHLGMEKSPWIYYMEIANTLANHAPSASKCYELTVQAI